MKDKIPVVLDTDIGTDIDDTWALAFLLKCPELDLKMVLTDTGDTIYRAKLAAKFLEIAGRTDVPVGVGLQFKDSRYYMQEWLAGYKLQNYSGKIYKDGVAAFIDTVMQSKEKITLICISSMPNIAAAIEAEPRIVKKLKFVGMQGSIYRGYDGKKKPDAEANVKYHTESCLKVFSTLKDIVISPLDTCGTIRIKGNQYKKIIQSKDPVLEALIENYRIWKKNVEWPVSCDIKKESSVLFDTAAVCLAFEEKYFKMKKLKIRISEDGMTIPDKSGIYVRAAIEWRDKKGFIDMLVDRLTGASC
ncbi:MAG: nucleoside hydrolase [Candidatus Goldbacteria bacterium]|nr:nucleoside hydrolase [Candidatus Goldiibacteriota bacterium]